MKKKIVLLLAVACFLGVSSYLLDKLTDPFPDFYYKLHDELKVDSSLMDEIGGYKAYQFTLNQDEVDQGDMKFEIVIVGNKQNLVCKGRAKYDQRNNKWVVENKEVEFTDIIP
ncbi:MAG: hypothetical protein AAF740_04605, partial [Bacteroidota bacterium]